jgi:acetyl-CoA carboxylase carboxyl transferase subunit alpha
MKKLKLVDDVIKEPLGGAHREQDEMFDIVRKHIKKYLKELDELNPEDRINARIDKFCEMGVWK